jgi:histidine triad (HIT) family protein
MKPDCVFCQIVAGKSPARFVYRDDLVVAFHDIHPAAPVHVILVPIRHIDSLAVLSDADAGVGAALLTTARRVASELGVLESGFRLIANTGRDGGQLVGHLHFHLLGGRPLGPKILH